MDKKYFVVRTTVFEINSQRGLKRVLTNILKNDLSKLNRIMKTGKSAGLEWMKKKWGIERSEMIELKDKLK